MLNLEREDWISDERFLFVLPCVEFCQKDTKKDFADGVVCYVRGENRSCEKLLKRGRETSHCKNPAFAVNNTTNNFRGLLVFHARYLTGKSCTNRPSLSAGIRIYQEKVFCSGRISTFGTTDKKRIQK